jgi:hypothetical protein
VLIRKKGQVMNTSANDSRMVGSDPIAIPAAQATVLAGFSFIRHRWGAVAMAVVLGMAAFGLGWAWLGLAAVLPLFYVLPCAAMLAFCMRCMRHEGGACAPPARNAASRSDNR